MPLDDDSVSDTRPNRSGNSSGILKVSKIPLTTRDGNNLASSREGVRWDEKVIAEHDKLRGTRMKISEPNTPYYSHRGLIDGPETPEALTLEVSEVPTHVPPDVLREQLEVLQLQSAEESNTNHIVYSDDDDLFYRPRCSKSKFEEKRKAHYNEFRMIKQMRSFEHSDSDSDSSCSSSCRR